jgi:hypothetical protein
MNTGSREDGTWLYFMLDRKKEKQPVIAAKTPKAFSQLRLIAIRWDGRHRHEQLSAKIEVE